MSIELEQMAQLARERNNEVEAAIKILQQAVSPFLKPNGNGAVLANSPEWVSQAQTWLKKNRGF